MNQKLLKSIDGNRSRISGTKEYKRDRHFKTRKNSTKQMSQLTKPNTSRDFWYILATKKQFVYVLFDTNFWLANRNCFSKEQSTIRSGRMYSYLMKLIYCWSGRVSCDCWFACSSSFTRLVCWLRPHWNIGNLIVPFWALWLWSFNGSSAELFINFIRNLQRWFSWWHYHLSSST